MTLIVRLAHWSEDEAAIRHVREVVFIEEQAVAPDLEWDGLDAECVHALAETENRDVVGTGRLHPGGKIGRMAVLRPWRQQGVGAAILAALVAQAQQRGHPEVYLHAQTRALAFYERQGFVAEGDEFDEAGIPHRLMRRIL